jgi:hypothetical protein
MYIEDNVLYMGRIYRGSCNKQCFRFQFKQSTTVAIVLVTT